MTRTFLLFAALACSLRAEETIRLQGSSVVAAALSLAAPQLRDLGIPIAINTEGGTGSGVVGLGDDKADIGMAVRHTLADERAQFPDKQFSEVQVASQAIAMLVPRDVWEAGVHAISRQQIQAIYEGKLTNWKLLGGEDRAIKFFNGERGRGVWEFFAVWIYGDIRKAPLGTQWETVIDGEDARNTVEFNAGSISLASPRWADGKAVFALAIKDDQGNPVEPTLANIAAKKYPLVRPLLLIFVDRPTGLKKKVLDFMLGDRGQSIFKKIDLIPMSDLSAGTQ
jgi:phosphate transport system substrate-binding protein